jgi:GMP synthase-like glutamine amidotransferase
MPEFEYNDGPYFARRGDRTENLLLFAGERAPDPRDYDLVIVYGGYMSAFDDGRHPWIAEELRFLEDCLRAGTKVFGICLGSQLLARLLGARVYPCPSPEFGFKRISLTAEGRADPFLGSLSAGEGGSFLSIEWHDDAWDLPSGARLLASSRAWPNQAFSYGPSVLAIQFHLEFTQPHMAWAVARPGEAESADPDREDRAAFSAPSGRYGEIADNYFRILDRLLA